MEHMKVGSLEVPSIVIGTWSWGNGYIGANGIYGNNISENDLKEVFMSAVRNDFTFYDTAEIYSFGDSERIIGELIEGYELKAKAGSEEDKHIMVSTKFMPGFFMKNNVLQKSVEGSLKRLKREQVEMFWLHVPIDYKKWTQEVIPLLKSNKIKNVGVSNFNLKQIIEAKRILNEAGFELAGVQNHLSLIYQNCINNGILDWCRENNVTFFAYMVIEQGALSGKYTKDHLMPRGSLRSRVYNKKVLTKLEKLLEYMKSLADKYGVKTAQIPVAWAIAKKVLPIIGVTQQQHVYELTKAQSVKLTDEEVKNLEEIARECYIGKKGLWEPKI